MNQPPDRLLFFDYVRYFIITWVVLYHVSASLSNAPEFLRDTDSHPFFTAFQGVSYLIMMSTMFYAAGFFALPSLQGRTYGQFLGRKLHRLGLPWLIGVVLLGPTMPYMGYYGHSFAGLQSDSYWHFLTAYLGNAFSAWVLPVQFTANMGFHHQHFWFLSVLWLFFALFAAAHVIHGRWGKGGSESTSEPTESTFVRAFVVGAIAIGGLMAMANWLDLPEGVVAVVFTLKSFDLIFHGVAFALGVYAYASGWYGSGRAPGKRTALLLLGSALVCGGLAAGSAALWGADSPLVAIFGLSTVALVTFILLLTLTSLAYHYRNTPEKVNARFAANSYIVYLIQYPIVLLFHLPFFAWEMSPFLKFALIAAPSLVACYALSEYLIRPYPKASTLGLAALLGALCLWGPPRSAYSHLLLDRLDSLNAAVAAGPYKAVLGASAEAGWRDPSPVSLVWTAGRLFFAAGGTLCVLEDGHERLLADSLEITSLSPWPGGGLAAAVKNQFVHLTVEGVQLQGDAIEVGEGVVSHLLADTKGGMYFQIQTETGDHVLYYRSASGVQQEVLAGKAFPLTGGGALSADGKKLFWGSGIEIRAFAVAEDGSVQDEGRVAEIFLGDGRYGQPRTKTTDGGLGGMAVDNRGRLFLASRVGLQVFDPTGRLLGVVQLPTQPLACALDGTGKLLYVAGAGQVFAVPLR